MGQVTIYLDSKIEAKVRAAAKSHKMSVSKWIAKLMNEKLSTSWSKDVIDLAGSWKDGFPSIEEIRSSSGEDYPREKI